MAPRKDRTPPSQETPEEDFAEGGEGGEGGEMEDNRDVFEKALDYGPFAGTVIGGILGGRMGAKKGSALYKKHEQIQARIRRLEAKGRNPNQGLTAKERTLLEKSRGDAEHVGGEYGSNLAGRWLKAAGGGIVGNVAGSAARDAGQKRRK